MDTPLVYAYIPPDADGRRMAHLMTHGTIPAGNVLYSRQMRKLWSDHVWWTRQVIVSVFGGLGDVAVALDRLHKNQVHIGDHFGARYGRGVANALKAALKEHIDIAAEIALVLKGGTATPQTLSDLQVAWDANAMRIAGALAPLNRHWTYDALLGQFRQHLMLTSNEAIARAQGKWADDLVNFDMILTQALAMADVLSMPR